VEPNQYEKNTQQNAKENCKTVKPVIWYMLK